MTGYDARMISAATAAAEQAMKFGIGIPVDPDVAEFMGAFEEEAILTTCKDINTGEQTNE